MRKNISFAKEVSVLAIPVALQCMLQSSFSIIDQIMIGQLGSLSIASIGLAGKFSSIFSVVVAAIGAVAGIMISQYTGSGDKEEADKSLSVNLLVATTVSLLFMLLCFIFPNNIMGIYSTEQDTVITSANYLRIISFTFIPLAITTCLSTMLRCLEKAMIPLYASIVAALCNTGLNYLLIFGKLKFPAMGVNGAAIATAISAFINMAVVIAGFIDESKTVFGYPLPHSYYRVFVEFRRKCLCNNIRTSRHKRLCGYDADNSYSGFDDRRIERNLTGCGNFNRQKAW